MPEFDGAAPIAPTGVNKVIQAATPLFALAVRLKNRAVHRDVPLLRERVIAEIRAFERNALATGATADAIRAARYGLCATIDDLVLNTPWGSQSVWTKQSMVSTFYNETWGGERFFDILDHLMKDPERTLDILELFYVCLALGFEGRYRIDPRGPARLSETRDSSTARSGGGGTIASAPCRRTGPASPRPGGGCRAWCRSGSSAPRPARSCWGPSSPINGFWTGRCSR